MADYSEFPTTPTRWQEHLMSEPEALLPAETPSTPTRQPVDGISVVIGLLFSALAILLMSGVDLPADWFSRGFGWVVLIGAGIALLVNEVRKARSRR